MADTEVDVPSAAPEQATEQAATSNAPEELPSYDPAKLIIVKGKVKKPVKPDDTERNLQLEKLSAEIKRHGDRIAEIKAIRDARRSRGVNPEAAEHKKRKEGLNAEWNAVLKQKMHIREEFQRANTEREVIKNELREVRSKIPRGTRLDTLEQDIQQLEYKLEHESMSAPEEKRAHTQMSALLGARPLARQTATLEEKLKVVEVNRASAKQRLDQCDAVLESIKEKERVETAALDEIRREREEANVDLPALEVEKQECWEIIQHLRQKMNEVREDFNVKWREWSELNKHWNAWRRHDQHRQYLERQAAREQRAADNDDGPSPAAAAGTAPVEPYESEIFTIDQLLAYLRKFVTADEAIVAKAEAKAVEVPQGLKPFKRKDEDDLSSFMAVKKRDKGGKGAKTEKAVQQVEPAKKRINHSLDMLQTFMTLGIDVPQSTAELPGTLAKAEAKKLEFLEKRKKAKEAPSPAPKAQVLPANGDANGHNEEDEDEVAAPAEPEADGPEAEEAAAAVQEKHAEAADKSASSDAASRSDAKGDAAAAFEAAASPKAAPSPKAAAAIRQAEPASSAKPEHEELLAEAAVQQAEPVQKSSVGHSAAKRDTVGVSLIVDSSSEALALKLDVPAGL